MIWSLSPSKEILYKNGTVSWSKISKIDGKQQVHEERYPRLAPQIDL